MRRVGWLLLALLLPGCAAPAESAEALPLVFEPGPDGLASVDAAGDAFHADLVLVEGARTRVTDLVVLVNRAGHDVPARLVPLGDAPGSARLVLRDAGGGQALGEVAWDRPDAPLDLVVPAGARLAVDLVADAPEGSAGTVVVLGLRLATGDGKPSPLM